MKINYPSKILLAWSEAIGGNKEIRDWLLVNGYKELGIFVFALWNKDDAREWLFENYRHLAAAIAASKGDKKALNWLKQVHLDVLAKMAETGDGDEEAFKWLIENNHREMAMIGKKIESVNLEIERDNNDVHKISKE